ncbi:GGDEF domain-containing protein [Thiomicrospira microaerophila]|uniref:GGDEF domain-containing protein n=1 Tax=Thiomicrospira microaerophila TaxID=406020 RepID=UPI00069819E7|nr:GGDEF domain-containing protein [Thiomicrospira microaerophila]
MTTPTRALDKKAKDPNKNFEQTAFELAERLKELECLYGLLELAQNTSLKREAFLQQAVMLLPPAFLLPDLLSAQINYKGKDFFSGSSSSLLKQNLTTSLIVRDQLEGFVMIGYREQNEEITYEFLPDEIQMLEAFTNELIQILDRYKIEDELRLLASVFENSYAGIMITNAENQIIRVNRAFVEITGYSAAEAVGKNPGFLSSNRHQQGFYQTMWEKLHQADFWRGEVWNRRKEGEVYAEMLSISLIRNDQNQPKYYIGVFSDISTVKEGEAELIRLAHYDALTGLPNRRLLSDRIKQGLAQITRNQQHLALCFLDLDNFKPVNDTYGHQAGDEVLIEVARRLKADVRQSDSLARLGGDEFVLLMVDIENQQAVEALLARVIEHIERPIKLESERAEVRISVSCGVVIYPQAGLDESDLLHTADALMYQAKKAGKSQICFWDSAQAKKK